MAARFPAHPVHVRLAGSLKGHCGVIDRGGVQLFAGQDGYRDSLVLVVAVDGVGIAAWLDVDAHRNCGLELEGADVAGRSLRPDDAALIGDKRIASLVGAASRVAGIDGRAAR